MGKQFPPFGNDSPDSWGVQHVMHPDLGEEGRILAQWYTSEAVRDVVKGLLKCSDEELQMELFNLLINPESHEFALRWHRDDVKGTATEEEEIEALTIWHHGVQWNTALYEDSCLFVVPGSHKVPRTPEQRAQSTGLEAPEDPNTMPGAISVTLYPGDTVFYNNNILHTGIYNHRATRATLHASVGDARGGSTRARNVLQHGLEWMEKDERFKNGLSDEGKKMLNRLITMKHAVGNGNGKVVYSQDG